ncbi:HAD domain-containing protein [Eleftheria terrae]|uniref:HAD domain-containing protein n=1 Tax=Eleftheria terrae TaxID=1597781 RepID=UPI00263B216B|nr:HAD domain-containing protein [Eleftheria terrae]WKB55436.1 HAD domain-containing protein [Eleftheria terrae]
MKELVGRAAPVLYLDFDGVLHHENVRWHPRRGAYIDAPREYRLFQHAELLEHLLQPYPHIRIVLSTSWVRVYSYSRARQRLPEALRARVVGATFHSEMDLCLFDAMPRGVQVLRDVQRREPSSWLALDDDGEGWSPHCLDRLVLTHEELGISAADVTAEIRRKLGVLAGPGCRLPPA